MRANMHANPEGLAPSIGSRPAAVFAGPDRTTDAGKDDLEIGRCASWLRSLIATGFLTTLLSAGLAFGWWPGFGDNGPVIGCAGVMLIGLATCWLIWRLPTEKGSVVVLTRYGVRDLRRDNEFLPWESIADVSAGRCGGHEVVVLKLCPALQRQRRCVNPGQDMRPAVRQADSDHIVVSPQGLSVSFETLLQTCRDFHAASEQRSASQQGGRDAGDFAARTS